MSIKERKYLYKNENMDGNIELDFLNKNFTDINLGDATTFRISKALEYRPDLISQQFFGNFHLGWLLALHNDFLDPIYDFKEGVKIKIPNYDEYFRYYKRRARRY